MNVEVRVEQRPRRVGPEPRAVEAATSVRGAESLVARRLRIVAAEASERVRERGRLPGARERVGTLGIEPVSPEIDGRVALLTASSRAVSVGRRVGNGVT
jgi:hypothetical protein